MLETTMVDLSRFTFMVRRFSNLSLAIQLYDRSALNLTPSGRIGVSLRNIARQPIKNPSGNFVYLDLDEGNYTVSIDSPYYLKKEFDVAIPLFTSPPESEINLGNDVWLKPMGSAVIATVDLMPDVNYPFPSGATLVRGEVVKTEDGTRKPIPEAIVRVTDLQASPPEDTGLEFQANQKGQFILFMNKLTKKVIKEINGKQFNGRKVDDKRLLLLQAIHPEWSIGTEVVVEDGKTTYARIEL